MVGSSQTLNSFKHLCMSLLPAKINKIQSKMTAVEWPQHISHCKYMGIFSDAKGQLTPQSKVGSDFMVILVTCKNEEDPINNEGARVATMLYVDFSDVQGQITP